MRWNDDKKEIRRGRSTRLVFARAQQSATPRSERTSFRSSSTVIGGSRYGFWLAGIRRNPQQQRFRGIFDIRHCSCESWAAPPLPWLSIPRKSFRLTSTRRSPRALASGSKRRLRRRLPASHARIPAPHHGVAYGNLTEGTLASSSSTTAEKKKGVWNVDKGAKEKIEKRRLLHSLYRTDYWIRSARRLATQTSQRPCQGHDSWTVSRPSDDLARTPRTSGNSISI